MIGAQAKTTNISVKETLRNDKSKKQTKRQKPARSTVSYLCVKPFAFDKH